MLTKAERQEARVMLATTHAGSRYKRELLYSALDSLDEMEEVIEKAIPYLEYGEKMRMSLSGEPGLWTLKRARKVIGE